jgi:hypothetical protein
LCHFWHQMRELFFITISSPPPTDQLNSGIMSLELAQIPMGCTH